MIRPSEIFNVEFLIYHNPVGYLPGYYWRISGRDMPMHGGFATENDARSSAEGYIRETVDRILGR